MVSYFRGAALGEASVTMAMARGPPLHRRPRGAGAAETTSWAVGGAPHMSPTQGGRITGARGPFGSVRGRAPGVDCQCD